MVKFLDGPAAGVTLCLARTPLYLRVCHRPHDASGEEWDALDQPTDTPRPGEVLTAYRRHGPAGTCHVSTRDKVGRRRVAWYATAEYSVLAEQPPAEVMADAGRWRDWCDE